MANTNNSNSSSVKAFSKGNDSSVPSPAQGDKKEGGISFDKLFKASKKVDLGTQASKANYKREPKDMDLSEISGLKTLKQEMGPYTLRLIKYKRTTAGELPLIDRNTDEIKGFHVVANALQLKKQDPGRCAINHLLNILYQTAGVDYSNAKSDNMSERGSSWLVVTPIDEDVAKKMNTAKMQKVKCFGFTYNDQLRTASYLPEHADIEKLAELSPKEVQKLYDELVDAAEKSHSYNSHNNQFSSTSGQDSSWLLMMNDIMKKVAKKQNVYEEPKIIQPEALKKAEVDEKVKAGETEK